MIYSKRQPVEVQSEDEESVWLTAIVTQIEKGGKLRISYHDKHLKPESVNTESVRPLRISKSESKTKQKYGRDMEVDYYEKDSWTTGIVCSVLSGDKYSIFCFYSHLQRTVKANNMRPHYDFDPLEGVWKPSSLNLTYEKRLKKLLKPLPPCIDWAKKGFAKPPRDQVGDTCYAHTSCGAVESRSCVAHDVKARDMPLIDCEYSKGYKEGVASLVLHHVVVNGIFRDEDYPMLAVPIPYTKSKHQSMTKIFEAVKEQKGEPLYKVVAVMILRNVKPRVIKEELAYGGVVIVRIDAYELKRYKKGQIWRSTRPAGQKASSTDLHWVLVVGFNVEKRTGTPYYICRNSWGTKEFGDNGYFKLVEGECDVHKTVIYPLIRRRN